MSTDSDSTIALHEPSAAATPDPVFSPEDQEGLESTIAIELNFNAFADHCPPTKHARRVGNLDDPSVQDFADQALELATLRAELKRLHREYEAMQQALRLRDSQVEALRERLASRSIDIGNTTRRILDDVAKPTVQQSAVEPTARSNEPSAATPAVESATTLKLPAPAIAISSAPHADAELAATRTGGEPVVQKRLVSVDDPARTIPLSRDIMTIGRTRQNDICIASRAVSRDHARLLISQAGTMLVDMGSANGCFVNEEPIAKSKLRDGDIVRIGDRSFRYCAH